MESDEQEEEQPKPHAQIPPPAELRDPDRPGGPPVTSRQRLDEQQKPKGSNPWQLTERGTGNFMPLQKDPPEAPPRARGELQDRATPGTYFPPSPEVPHPSAREILGSCGTNPWFFQGAGFRGADLGFTAEVVFDSLQSYKRPDGTVKPIFAGLAE
eukprot:15482197-Alexandrium_andersonii.AAC.1